MKTTSASAVQLKLSFPQSAAAAASTTTTTRSSRPFTTNSLNQATPFSLCFLRHGQSTWNRDNRFIGWTDTPLTDQGVLEARVAGQMLRHSNLQFDEVHTSLLRRSIRTTNVVLMELSQEYIPVHKSWRLNERNYGDLVGKNKKQCVAECGAVQVKRWRRSYDEPPPPMRDDHPHHPANDPRYRNVRVVCVHNVHYHITSFAHLSLSLNSGFNSLEKYRTDSDTLPLLLFGCS